MQLVYNELYIVHLIRNEFRPWPAMQTNTLITQIYDMY